MVQAINQGGPWIVFGDEDNHSLKFLDIDICSREAAFFWESDGLAAAVYEKACCFHKNLHLFQLLRGVYTIVSILCQYKYFDEF